MKIQLKEANIQVIEGKKDSTKTKHFFKNWMTQIIFLIIVLILIQTIVFYFYIKNLDDQLQLAKLKMHNMEEWLSKRIQRVEKSNSDGKMILNRKSVMHIWATKGGIQ